MNTSPIILIYGRDPGLLDTRGWVLERAGFNVVGVNNLKQAEAVAVQGQIALLVLCHTLSPEDCQDVLTAADAMWPAMKKLLMTASTEVCAAGRGQPTVSAFDGPRALIALTRQLLDSSKV